MVILFQPPHLWPLSHLDHYFPTRTEADDYLAREDQGDGLGVGLGSGIRLVSSLTFVCSGVTLIVGSSVSFLIAMTWAGIRFPWTSAQVLAPLVVGAVGIVAFFIVEAFWLKRPTVSSN